MILIYAFLYALVGGISIIAIQSIIQESHSEDWEKTFAGCGILGILFLGIGLILQSKHLIIGGCLLVIPYMSVIIVLARQNRHRSTLYEVLTTILGVIGTIIAIIQIVAFIKSL